MSQNKKPRNRKASGEPGANMSHNQSLRFINAMNGYMAKRHAGLSEVSDLCEVPLSQVGAWFSRTEPFPGVVPKRVLARFCANAHIGRDELMAYGNVAPFIGFVQGADIEEAPEYIRRGLKRKAGGEEPTGIDEAHGEPSETEEVDGGPAVASPEIPVVASTADSELVSDTQGDVPLDGMSSPDSAPVQASSAPGAVDTAPLATLAIPSLTPYEHAILTLMREHDAALGASRGEARPSDGIAAEAAGASVDPEEHAALEHLLDEARANLDVANKTIEALRKSEADNGKSLRRKDNEIDRLTRAVGEMESRNLCSGAYREFIEKSDLFVKRNLTPMDAYTTASVLWKDRLFFTKKAVADVRDYHGDAHELLEALRALAIPLLDCLMSDDQLDEPGLRAACGFEISLHESDLTLNNKRYKQERTASYGGADRIFEKHLKAGNGAGCLRIYFDIDRDAGCMVIGRCGAHLPTRRKF